MSTGTTTKSRKGKNKVIINYNNIVCCGCKTLNSLGIRPICKKDLCIGLRLRILNTYLDVPSLLPILVKLIVSLLFSDTQVCCPVGGVHMV